MNRAASRGIKGEEGRRCGKARQGKARQGKARQGKARQGASLRDADAVWCGRGARSVIGAQRRGVCKRRGSAGIWCKICHAAENRGASGGYMRKKRAFFVAKSLERCVVCEGGWQKRRGKCG